MDIMGDRSVDMLVGMEGKHIPEKNIDTYVETA